METLKSIGGAVLGIIIFIGIIVGAILLFTLGVQASVVIAPYVYAIAGILFFVNIITLLSAIIPNARGAAGWILFISSYIYGLATWIYGLLVTLSLWGVLAIIIGLFLGGVGVVPIGMLAAIFHGRWDIFFTLLILVILTYGTRMVGMALAESHERRSQEDDNIIELKAENEDKRSWRDLE
ncbi:MAG: hypothetical protein M0R47_21515 [Methylobacter sp.]|uniref:hypothetical protein n=1 Tax=Methylobacter sp. TaxID=2051955 RepID=UPI0025F605E9|nr:hypothetical protein [Methylobacter sp.]MCK9623101.1 hypothetical protein [Methylobacter sp.]